MSVFFLSRPTPTDGYLHPYPVPAHRRSRRDMNIRHSPRLRSSITEWITLPIPSVIRYDTGIFTITDLILHIAATPCCRCHEVLRPTDKLAAANSCARSFGNVLSVSTLLISSCTYISILYNYKVLTGTLGSLPSSEGPNICYILKICLVARLLVFHTS
ncbi:hypothetical protein C8J57DRAFT_1295252 [Mycena rebaudengoi]|nr:hypothetical protein C8J57DRAFT_1295245 [Mycena rebaudengoi]KAJ7282391.1 hypothetical protein C8J57DRAFT_1295252 [Mycena rebaudengoi]